MGRYVAIDSPRMDALVSDVIRDVGREIDALQIPRLRGVVLGGGYGRGEGGVFLDGENERLSNDLDFYVVAEDGVTSAEIAVIGESLAPVAKRWTDRLGIDVDFCTAKTPWRLRHDQRRLMVQELLHGYVDVAGESGDSLFRTVERREPSDFPWTEAVRLLVNRGAGLLLARESDDPAFVVRNLNKCVLGAGDAVLIARGAYRWKAVERASALGWKEYDAAVEWKFRPRRDGTCDRDTAQRIWLAAREEVMAQGRRSHAIRRSFYQAARWIARRRTLGELRTIGMDAVVRILRVMTDVIREGKPFSAALRKDWLVFN
ncbi:MAG: hypothetical protein IJR99_00410 [Kiritimatiellae bacterium]|nr:hypothetical protein [Kiritimatiellia bacterium]